MLAVAQGIADHLGQLVGTGTGQPVACGLHVDVGSPPACPALFQRGQREGLTLSKSRRRDPDATDYGRWSLHNAATGKVILQGALQDVE